ncbi:hypothetical protein BHM03_00024200 [Ensete ventricosum]|nr:hypothetical protein BHM03_00024200 [Ensete ventricosum]
MFAPPTLHSTFHRLNSKLMNENSPPDAIDAADDLVDELHYKALHEQVEQMTGAAADQEGSEIQLNVFRGFQTGGDDVAN